ncbi:MAG TPA: CoA-transferase, partial [Acidimicrobiales bacterium]|nr:CoA-transferase [Acidimicrobiales bacterium]
MSDYTADEIMAVEGARRMDDGAVCFVGIGLPSRAANLARRTHAPNLVLVYESGTIGAKPDALPLSIGDGELAETAESVVSVPEMFAYWLQGGRIDIGFLGAAQIDRHGNLNSTVIGDYDHPKVRLPGGGGAPEIATEARGVFVMLRQTARTFVERLDFTTSVGDRVRVVVTDLGVLEPRDGELTLVAVHPGVTADE